MAKNKKRKLPMIGVMGYLTLDELFEQLYEYIEDNIGSDGDYKEIAEYLWRFGEGGEWKLEIAYFKLVAERIKDIFPNSYSKLMDFIKEFESEELKF